VNPFNLSEAEMLYMDEVVKYTLPWPPSINNYYAPVSGRMILKKPGRAYKKLVQQIVLLNPQPRLVGKLAIDLVLCEPDKRRRDIDNVLKAVLDSLTSSGAYTDDSQIRKLFVEFGEAVKLGVVHVSLRNY
jgi:crossover junction endodeoxyribonuclease RusA